MEAWTRVVVNGSSLEMVNKGKGAYIDSRSKRETANYCWKQLPFQWENYMQFDKENIVTSKTSRKKNRDEVPSNVPSFLSVIRGKETLLCLLAHLKKDFYENNNM